MSYNIVTYDETDGFTVIPITDSEIEKNTDTFKIIVPKNKKTGDNILIKTNHFLNLTPSALGGDDSGTILPITNDKIKIISDSSDINRFHLKSEKNSGQEHHGLIENGSKSNDGRNDVTISGIHVHCERLASYAGGIGRRYFGKSVTEKNLIDECSFSGEIKDRGGGIIGANCGKVQVNKINEQESLDTPVIEIKNCYNKGNAWYTGNESTGGICGGSCSNISIDN